MTFDFRVGRFVNAVGLERALDTASEIVKAAGEAHVGDLKSAFLVGGHGDRGGEQWAPWSPKYAKRQALRGRSKILMDKGHLRASINAQLTSPGPDYVVMIGSNVPYAKVHQFGFSGNVTRRAFAQNDIRKRGDYKNRKQKDGSVKRVWVKGKQQVGTWRHFEEWKGAMTIPARPFLVTTDQDVTKTQQRIARSVDHVLNGPGGMSDTPTV